MRTKFSMIFLKILYLNHFIRASCAINFEFTLFVFSCEKAFISVRFKLENVDALSIIKKILIWDQ